MACHPAYALEGPHAHTHFQPDAEPGGLRIDMVLQRSACKPHEMLVQDFRKSDLPCRGKRMIARYHHHQPVDREGSQYQARRIDCIRKDADLGQPGRNGTRDLDALTLPEIDIGSRVSCHPVGKARRQVFGDRGGVGEKPDGRAQAVCMFAKLTAHLCQLPLDHPCMMGQRFAGGRRIYAAPPAFQKLHAAIRLHVAQPLAGGRQRKPDIGGSMRDAAGIDDGEEEAKVDQIEAHEVQITASLAFGIAEGSVRIIRIVQVIVPASGWGMMDYSIWLVVAIFATFFVAGMVKGVTGMGLPTVAMGVLGVLISPLAAASLLIVPSFVTNVWQLLAGPNFARFGRRLFLLALAITAGTFGGSYLLAAGDTRVTTAALGAALVIYAGHALLARQLRVPPRLEPLLSPIIGLITGLLTGATGVFVVPAVPYLQALGLEKEELVQALGLSFTVSTVALAAALAWHGAFRIDNLALSTLAIVPALAGMWAGQIIRNRVSPATFRRWFLICLLVLGAEMVVKAAF